MAEKIVSAIDLWIPDSVAPKEDMNRKWEIVTTTVAPLTNERRKAKIPDENAYQNKIVEIANQSWAGVINPAYRSKSGRTYEDIKGAHDTNLQKSFHQWTGKLDQAYATVDGVEAKRFKDQIQATKGFWGKKAGDKSLRLTGDSIRGEGAATIAVHWLIGEPSAVGMLRAQDTGLLGGPYRICPEDLSSSLKSALMPKLVKAGMAIFNNQYEASTIVRQNLAINDLVQRFIDPTLNLKTFTPGGKSHLDYVKEGALLKLSLQVTKQ